MPERESEPLWTATSRWRDGLDCENPACAHRRSLRRLLRRNAAEGVFLQGRWYCCRECFEQVVVSEFAGLLKQPDQPVRQLHRIPLGLILLGHGAINQEQLRAALAAQRESSNERIGRLLMKNGSVSADAICTALAAQWGCGIFPIERSPRYRDCSQMLPLALIESSRMIPVHYHGSTEVLYLAFAENIDHTAIYSVERQLRTRTEPCLITEEAMEKALDEIRPESRPNEIVFETLWEVDEIARTVRDYSVALGTDELLLARPRRFLWARLKAAGQAHDLLFRLPGSGDE
jgi:hypothetical protein